MRSSCWFPLISSRFHNPQTRHTVSNGGRLWVVLGCTLGLFAITASATAQNKVTNAAGRTFEGRITGVENGAVQIQGASGTIGVQLNQITAVEMPAPEAVAQAVKAMQAGKNKEALALITPVANQFAGLPTPWARNATRMAAELNIAEGNLQAAETALTKYEQLYPGDQSAQVGRARIAIEKKQFDRARQLLEPILKKASETSDFTGPAAGLFSQAFLVNGVLFEAEGSKSEALQNYLTTVTIFAADAPAVATARARADVLMAAGDVFVP